MTNKQSIGRACRRAILLLMLLLSQLSIVQAQITPSNYEHTMSVTSQLYINGLAITTEGYSIQVYNGAELLGSSEYNTPINGKMYSFMTVYSNSYFGDYTLQITNPDNTMETIGTLSFESNAIIGTIAIPEIYTIGTLIEGCTDETASNYSPTALVDDGSCEDIVYGCTDEAAINYTSEANTDDNSCIAQVLGCTDESASNYNAQANTDDSSCVSWQEAYSNLSDSIKVGGVLYNEIYADGEASVIPEDGINQTHVNQAYEDGAASVTPEDGIGQADVDNAYSQGLLDGDDGVYQSDVDAIQLAVSSLELTVNNQELELSTQLDSIQILGSIVDGLESMVISQESELSVQGDSILVLNSELVSQSELVEDYVSSVSSLELTVDSLGLENESLSSSVQSLTTNLEIALANQSTHTEVDRFIDIPQGWSMFGYTCADSVNVVDALGAYQDQIEIVKDEWGLAWLIEYGYNALGNLHYGQGYQIKTYEAIEEFQFCPNIE